ncbi:MAG: nicotinate-nucleotide adenylyltransferase [Blastocatellia bacterium]|nr:nicotinate-nucleotide adenylyltransferase [Blastocatellia bacterium]MCS7157337.1 nicotinate-nucleotide adenylyltransferase [Blastocatellia bacterium]MCX7753203.1 nicotinate-nucleotide adenylyltransferase [Blastocatellia bacterium]MDW8168241.1 nicotinate-nucleotide adenylyltransferase [Acidobacteriota bacterium]MDW8255465.1 nicotinate-nucleotide adenylyltransferase [Acidobacteriota bacterium]
MRIGIFGGTFDPVHNGHLEIADKVGQWFSLDCVHFVPAARSPHKVQQPEATAWDRFAMLVLATRAHERFYVSTLELERGGASYTIETIREFRRRMDAAGDLYFLMGADAFRTLPAWKDYAELLQLTNLIVVSRPGHTLSAEWLPETFRAHVRLWEPDRACIRDRGPRIYLCSGVHNEISATAIRAARRRGETIAHLVPPDVAAYIEKYRLYRDAITT